MYQPGQKLICLIKKGGWFREDGSPTKNPTPCYPQIVTADGYSALHPQWGLYLKEFDFLDETGTRVGFHHDGFAPVDESKKIAEDFLAEEKKILNPIMEPV